MKKNIFFIALFIMFFTLISIFTINSINTKESNNSKLILQQNSCNTMKLSADYEVNTLTLTADVSPIDAYDKTLNWSLNWTSENYGNISDYIGLRVSDDTLSANITYKKVFNGEIIVKVSSIINSSVYATCNLSCYQVPTSLNLKPYDNDYSITDLENNKVLTSVSSYNNTSCIDINITNFDNFLNSYYKIFNRDLFDMYLVYTGTERTYYSFDSFSIELSEELIELLSSFDLYDNISTSMTEEYNPIMNSFCFGDLLKTCFSYEDENFNNVELYNLYKIIFESDIPIFKINTNFSIYKDSVKTQLHSTHQLFYYFSFKNINIDSTFSIDSIVLNYNNIIL